MVEGDFIEMQGSLIILEVICLEIEIKSLKFTT